MDDVDYTVRTAAPEDLPAIRTALAHAIDWRGHGGWESPEALIEQTGHTFLLAEWGREGDGAVVAEVGGRAVGAAWRRYWTDASHSYGYVDASTPEIGVGVDPGFRRRGIGTSLMTGLLAQAARQGVPSVSLSVERYNPAVLLYRRLGFEHHADLENAWTMLKRLGPWRCREGTTSVTIGVRRRVVAGSCATRVGRWVESYQPRECDGQERRMTDRKVVGKKVDVAAVPMVGAGIEGVVKRVLVSPEEGWDGWVMRLFDVGPGGHTPKHAHDWPHINFVASGRGQLHLDGADHALEAGSYAYVPAGHEHQFRAAADEPLSFICIVPEAGDY